ncbi:hypothetical protein OSB04_006765 [Centaurea solstitialis]|uniref:Retrovirus-related Pol polyprotein from transposon TNT 1-94-like beta-barrel domain-containing protein n=1 Tax=Centaurea solstitialis TaxID=347529 RepID=A0AA38WQG6_9ASTR|nr:hypothetical protein OSB04_006765 [Centaurea solstitialis]
MKDIFKSANNLRSNITDSKSVFKKRRLMNVQKSSTPLVFTNVAFEDYIDSFSPSEKKNSIQRKFMSQSQMGIFRFGQSETQENCAFVCIVRPLERKLSSDAPEFVPKLKSNFPSDNFDLLETTNSESICREQSSKKSIFSQNLDGPVLIDKDLLTSDSKDEFLSDTESEACSEVSMPISLSNEPISEISNTSDLLSLSDFEESSTQFIDIEIYAHCSKEQELYNAPIILKDPKIDIPICPSIKNLSITVMTSVDIQRKSKKGINQQRHKNNFNKESRIGQNSCNEKPNPRKGSNKYFSVPFFDTFNEEFKKHACKVNFCNGFHIMHMLSKHLHHSSCLVTHPKSNDSEMHSRHFGNSQSKKSKTKPKNALAYFKHANQKGPKPRVSTWVVDSGCSRHMTGTLELLSSYIKQEGSSVAFGGNQKGKIKGYGMIVKGEVRMNQVSYVDGLKHN